MAMTTPYFSCHFVGDLQKGPKWLGFAQSLRPFLQVTHNLENIFRNILNVIDPEPLQYLKRDTYTFKLKVPGLQLWIVSELSVNLPISPISRLAQLAQIWALWIKTYVMKYDHPGQSCASMGWCKPIASPRHHMASHIHYSCTNPYIYPI
jgi:hypothetical protein